MDILTLTKQNKKVFLLLPFIKKQMVKQFIGYLISGTIATIVHYTLLIYLVEIYFSPVIIASSAGFIGGAITGFTLNKQFVFNDHTAVKTAGFKYTIMVITSAGLNMLLLFLLTKFMHLYYLFAQIIATISIIIYNFTCCKMWIFNKGKA